VYLPVDHHITEQQIELGYALAQQVTLAIQLTWLADEAKLAAIARAEEANLRRFWKSVTASPVKFTTP